MVERREGCCKNKGEVGGDGGTTESLGGLAELIFECKGLYRTREAPG